MSDKLQLGIYRVKDVIESQQGKKVSVNIQYLQKFFKEKHYKEQDVQPDLSETFDIFLFFKRTRSKIRWKGFIENIAKDNAPIIKYKNTNHESYVLLLQNKTTGTIYATTGGYGYTVLQGIIEEDFGLEILSRLVKAGDKTLRSTKERNLIGGIFREVKFFRSNYNFNENENFGTFYQEIHFSLNKNLLIETFGFDKTDIDSDSLCVAKNSFTIKKSINFKQLSEIIIKCEDLIKTVNPAVEINSIKKLTKTHKDLIGNLNKELDKSIIEYYSGSGNSVDISIELCHKDFDKYLHADNFILEFKIKDIIKEFEFDEPLKNIVDVIKQIREEKLNLTDKELLSLINNAHITSKDSNGDVQTKDLLKNHFYTEVAYDGKSYFLIDGEWFEIKTSFTKRLNEQCQDFVNRNTSNINFEAWDDTEKENDFNAKHIGKENFLVFDKFTPENIEVCDILHWDANNMYFIHVKEGFDHSMRDLSLQIYIAARRIKEDIKTGYEFIGKLYDTVKHSKGTSNYSRRAINQLQSLEEEEFIDLFKTRKPVFVLAVKDKAVPPRSLNKIEDFNSNIAKFSLHELVKDMKNLDVDLEICEL